MALEHVAEYARVFVVRGAIADIEVFQHGDLDVIDVVAVPQRFEDRVAESEDDQVLDRVFAKVVIDSEELVFGGTGMYRFVLGAAQTQSRFRTAFPLRVA